MPKQPTLSADVHAASSDLIAEAFARNGTHVHLTEMIARQTREREDHILRGSDLVKRRAEQLRITPAITVADMRSRFEVEDDYQRYFRRLQQIETSIAQRTVERETLERHIVIGALSRADREMVSVDSDAAAAAAQASAEAAEYRQWLGTHGGAPAVTTADATWANYIRRVQEGERGQ